MEVDHPGNGTSSLILIFTLLCYSTFHPRWRINGKAIPTWNFAARVMFAFSPNSACCERVFSLMSSMFNTGQDSLLADCLQASLMLKYNKRVVG